MKSIIKVFLSLFLIIGTVAYAADTASILPPAKTTFVDQNGKPLTSGTVDFYIPSTTTRKATWQDAAETILNTNPVVLDAAGRALILGSGSYRQVVKDRLGNIVWDQITSSAGSGSSSSTATGDGDLVGTIKPWAGLIAPNQYMFSYGQEISRTTYLALYNAITSTQAVFCSSGSPILSGLSDTTNFPIGAAVEISCLVSGRSTVLSKTATTITLAANANVNTNTTAIIFPWGDGDHLTTFNLPDFRGLAPIGNNNMGGVASTNVSQTYYNANPNSIGAKGGAESRQLTIANLPPFTPTGNIVSIFSAGSSLTPVANLTAVSGATDTNFVSLRNNANATAGTISSPVTGTVTSTFTGNSIGSNTPIGSVTPSMTTNYIIKVTPDTNSATASGVTSLGGMTGDIACGGGLTCTGNIINTANPLSGVVNSVAALKALTGGAFSNVTLISYYGNNDYASGGLFIWDNASVLADNAGTIIQPNAGGTGRWVRQLINRSQYTPEMFGARRDGTDDQTFVNATMIALGALSNKGTLRLSCNSAYTISSYSAANPISLINPLTGVNVVGCGNSSIIKVGNGVNTSLKFANVLYAASTINDVYYADFTIDFNGFENMCRGSGSVGTCWQSNAGVGMYNGDNVTVKNIKFINNPGSNDVVIGTNAEPPTVTNAALVGLIHEHSGDIVNAASLDFSAEFIIATNATLVDSRFSDGPRTNGSAFEIHGTNVTTSNMNVKDYFGCFIIANLTASPLVKDIAVDTITCNNVHTAGSIFSFPAALVTNVTINNVIVDFKSGDQGNGIDACSNVDPATGALTNLLVTNNIINSNVTSNLSNDASGIWACRWTSATFQGNQTFNTQGPGVRLTTSVNNAAFVISNNQFINPGRGSTAGLKGGVVIEATGGVTTDVINIQNNQIKGASANYGVIGAQNSTGGVIVGNIAPLAAIGPTNWTGTGTLVIPTYVTTVNGTSCTLGTSCTIVAAATSIAVGTTTITSGTSNGLLFNNAGVLGNTAAGTSGQLFLGVTAGAPNWGTMSGDATITNAGVITLATVNTNTGPFGSATSCVTVTNNGKGLTTAVSAATCTPAIGSVTGLGANVATFLVSPTSANLAAAITDETGTAGKLVFDTNPVFPSSITVTNNVSAGTVQNVAITNPGATATFTLGSGKTVNINNSMTQTATDGSTVAFGTGGTVLYSGTAIATGAHTITSASANALAVGLNGATNPAFNVDASTASQAAGFNITGAATGGTVTLATIDSGSNTNLTINAKGSGTIGIGTVSTGAITITPAITTGSTINGATLNNTAWTTYTPTISSTGGTLAATGTTMSGVSGRFKQIGKVVIAVCSATVTVVGTASGTWFCTLPVTSGSGAYTGSSVEVSITGRSGGASISSGTPTLVSTRQADTTTYWTVNYTVVITITYEAA